MTCLVSVVVSQPNELTPSDRSIATKNEFSRRQRGSWADPEAGAQNLERW